MRLSSVQSTSISFKLLGYSQDYNSTHYVDHNVSVPPYEHNSLESNHSHAFDGKNIKMNYGVVIGNVRFFDSGGKNGNYENNENKEITFYPSDPSEKMTINFDYFDLDSYGDTLKVFHGPKSDSSALIGTFSTTRPSKVTSKDSTGALTVQFISSSYGISSGWSAAVSSESNLTTPVLALDQKEITLYLNQGTKLLSIMALKIDETNDTYRVDLNDSSLVDIEQNSFGIQLSAKKEGNTTLNVVTESGLKTSVSVRVFASENEGSASTPVEVKRDEVYQSRIGAQYGEFDTNYYSFESNSSGYYLIDFSVGSFKVSIYDTNFNYEPLAYSYNKLSQRLNANTRYYIKVENRLADERVEFDMKVSSPSHEGSLYNPIDIEIDKTITGSVGHQNDDEHKYSYYQLFTEKNASYSIRTSNEDASLRFELFSNNGFSERVCSRYLSNDGYFTCKLQANRNYYIRLESESYKNVSYQFKISEPYSDTTAETAREQEPLVEQRYTISGTRRSNQEYAHSYSFFDTPEENNYTVVVYNSSDRYYTPSVYITALSDFSGYNYDSIGTYDLNSSTRYYIKTTGQTDKRTEFSMIVIPSLSDGTYDSPKYIELDTQVAAYLGVNPEHIFSYYTFTAAKTASYKVTLASEYFKGEVKVDIFSDSEMSDVNRIASTTSLSTDIVVMQGSNYYIRVENKSEHNFAYKLSITKQ